MNPTNPSVLGRPAWPSAVLFDLDGTLIDSERSWLEAIRSRLLDAGMPVSPALLAEFEGLSADDAARALVEVGGLSTPATEVAAELEDLTIAAFAGQLSWMPGAERALQSLRQAGIPLALVTSSTRRWVDAVADDICLGTFEAVVTVDDVQQAKPHAEPYLRATGLLGVDPRTCVVFEDSSIGVHAAVAAGCPVVQVRPDGQEATIRPTARIPDLRAVTAPWVASVLSREPALP